MRMNFFIILWYIIYFIQFFLGFGTAYRLTKENGDNGVSLWGWMLLIGLASLIPGLGFYLWSKYKESDHEYSVSDYNYKEIDYKFKDSDSL